MAARRARGLLLAAACLAFSVRATAQTVVPVSITGDAANRLDVVFLGDGYRSDEMGKFAADVNVVVANLVNQPVFREYQGYLNIRRIEVASTDSGASHPNQGITRNTAFGAYYNCSNIERLICVNTNSVLFVLQAALPADERDFAIVLVNDTEYGGSGGTFSVASVNSSSVEIVLHEMGHTFGQLADEYGGPPPPDCRDSGEPAMVNATKETDRARIKWAVWIDASTAVPTTRTTNGVPGLYAGAMYCDATLYRPVYNSKMRSLFQDFWQINDEQLIKRIYAYVDPIDGMSPPSGAIEVSPGGSQVFSVTTPTPATHALRIAWFVDGTQKSSAAQFTLSEEDLAIGSHTVQVVVTDPSSAVHTDAAGVLTGQAVWTLAVQRAIEISLDPASVEGGTPSTGTITLGSAAPTGGQVVILTSGNTAAATVPASVTVAAGSRTATFTALTVSVSTTATSAITGSCNGTSYAATLTVTASKPDFTIGADKTSLTLTRGQTGTVKVTLSPTKTSFAGDVTLSCSGLPLRTQCAFAPPSIASGSGLTAVTLTLTTSAGAGLAIPALPPVPPARRFWPLASAWLLLSILVVWTARRSRPGRYAALLGVVAVLASCGGSSGPSSGSSGTPSGTYTVVVSATSGGITHTASITLVVH